MVNSPLHREDRVPRSGVYETVWGLPRPRSRETVAGPSRCHLFTRSALCRAHDDNIGRRCEHPAVPDTGRCERHQDVPEIGLYSARF
jgi:hypothetical protein